MAQALGQARARGRGRGGRGRGSMMPPGATTLPLRIKPGQSPLGRNGAAPAPGGNRNGGRPNPPGVGMMNPPGQDNPPGGGRGRRGGQGGGKGQGGGAVGQAAMPGPGGRQLAAKVASGAITQEQADRTMKQRQTLKKALGPDWRDKLSVGGKSFAQVNKGLKANPGNAKLAAIRQKLVSNRAKVLAGARSKGQGGGGTEAPEPAGKRRRKQPAGVE